MTKRIAFLTAAACIGGVGSASVAQAELVNYTIDPAQSSLSVTGTLTGNFAFPQGAGSTTTSYSGTIVANRTATHIEFPGGSAMNAANLPTDQQPFGDGSPGDAPANYGRTADGPPIFPGTTTLEAIRGLSLDIFDDTSGLGIPITGDSFSSLSLGLEIDAGESDASYGTVAVGDNDDFVGKGTSNGAQTASTITADGNLETLTLRWNTGAIGYNVAGSGDSSLAFSGTIVATRTIIPEPAGLGLLGGAALIGLARRHRRAANVLEA